jgi:hypothetical protein
MVAMGRLRTLTVQVQPELAKSSELTAIKNALEAIARRTHLVEHLDFREGGEDGGRYLNFSYRTNNLPTLWAEIRRMVLSDPLIGEGASQAIIVVCEGDHGWDDYLLLYHFDQSVKLDKIEEHNQ